MVFSSLTFLCLFLPIVFGIYFILPNRSLRNLWLFVTSLIFYSWGEPVYIVLMIISTLNDFTFAQLVQKSKDEGRIGSARLYFVTSLIINLALLGYFKYVDFLIVNINNLFGANIPLKELPLPIGISFYTFQTMSYSIDVYMGNVKAQKKFLPMATYVTLFPQLIAGPIVRYITIQDELINRKESFSDVVEGLRRFVLGLGKKVIIANQMGLIADTIYNNSNSETGTLILWIAAIAYTFQIYFDFSGYSDMAIGLGRMFGFHFLENFNFPYISKSITEFWRRWHISLGTWFKDYLYIPLGGNRKYSLRNLLIVWFLTGLWHGASWNYVIWGMYYCILLIIEKYILGKSIHKIPKILRHMSTLFLIVIGWVIFRLEDLGQLKYVLKNLFVYKKTTLNMFLFNYQDMLYALPFILIAIIGSVPLFRYLSEKIESGESVALKYLYDIYIFAVFAISFMFLLGETFNPFIYFRF